MFNKKFIGFRFFNIEYLKLGPELHAATYTIKLGGKIRFNNSNEWLTKLEQLPKNNILDSGVYLQHVDLSKTVIQTEGLSNLGEFNFSCFKHFKRFFNKIFYLFKKTVSP